MWESQVHVHLKCNYQQMRDESIHPSVLVASVSVQMFFLAPVQGLKVLRTFYVGHRVLNDLERAGEGNRKTSEWDRMGKNERLFLIF